MQTIPVKTVILQLTHSSIIGAYDSSSRTWRQIKKGKKQTKQRRAFLRYRISSKNVQSFDEVCAALVGVCGDGIVRRLKE